MPNMPGVDRVLAALAAGRKHRMQQYPVVYMFQPEIINNFICHFVSLYVNKQYMRLLEQLHNLQ